METKEPTILANAEQATAHKAPRGLDKAAILCVALGQEFAGEVMQMLDLKEKEKLSLAIARFKTVDQVTAEPIIQEFNTLMQGAEWLAEGGLDYARRLLEDTVGKAAADEILRRIQKEIDDTGLNRIRKADPEQLRTVLRGEHPQTIALIMAHLEPRQCSTVLEGFELELATDVLYRIARMEKVSPEMLEIIDKALVDYSLNLSTQMSSAGGPAHVAEVLNFTPASLEKEMMERLAVRDGGLAGEIKKLMFVFEDLVRLDDRSIQAVLQAVDIKDLGLGLKVASAALSAKIYANMSQRASESLKEELEFMPPVRKSDVDAAQARIILVVRQLEAEGRVVIMGGDGDVLV